MWSNQQIMEIMGMDDRSTHQRVEDMLGYQIPHNEVWYEEFIE